MRDVVLSALLWCTVGAYAHAEFYVACVTSKDNRCSVEWGNSVLFIAKKSISLGILSVVVHKPLNSNQFFAYTGDSLAPFLAYNICVVECPGKTDVQYPLPIEIEIMSLADATRSSAEFLKSNSIVVLYTDKSFEAHPASKTEVTVSDNDTPDMDEIIAVEKDVAFDKSALAQRVVYPAKAQEDKIEGEVVLGILVGENGIATKCQVLESTNSIFNANAAKAALLTTFDPAIQNGKPIQVWVRIPVTFKLK